MDILNLFGFIENLALYFPKMKTIAISFLSLSLSAVDRGELFCSCKQTFIVLKIQYGFHHLIGVVLAFSQANICTLNCAGSTTKSQSV